VVGSSPSRGADSVAGVPLIVRGVPKAKQWVLQETPAALG
jgi:hypothetical protein